MLYFNIFGYAILVITTSMPVYFTLYHLSSRGIPWRFPNQAFALFVSYMALVSVTGWVTWVLQQLAHPWGYTYYVWIIFATFHCYLTTVLLITFPTSSESLGGLSDELVNGWVVTWGKVTPISGQRYPRDVKGWNFLHWVDGIFRYNLAVGVNGKATLYVGVTVKADVAHMTPKQFYLAFKGYAEAVEAGLRAIISLKDESAGEDIIEYLQRMCRDARAQHGAEVEFREGKLIPKSHERMLFQCISTAGS